MLLFAFIDKTDKKTYNTNIRIITPEAIQTERRKRNTTESPTTMTLFRNPDDFNVSLPRQPKQRVLLPPNVKTVYSIIRSATGSIGGNADGGAIYGETTAFSLQNIINLMKAHANFTSDSRFIDVGSGLGKPNLHVAQDPGVRFSCGIEVNRIRWMLSLNNLLNVLQYRIHQSTSGIINEANLLGFNCFFSYGDISMAETFNPFTHVYMFDIGFPPNLMTHLSTVFNRSCSSYLICYHPPAIMIVRYKFDIILMCQQNTTMHGSGENHTGYIYRRTIIMNNPSSDFPIDPIFMESWNIVNSGLHTINDVVCRTIALEVNAPRAKRR